MTQTHMTFAQGLQLFFIERILSEKSMGTEARSRRGIAFFAEWSRIACENKETKGFPLTVKVPDSFTERAEIQVHAAVFKEVEGKRVPLFAHQGEPTADLNGTSISVFFASAPGVFGSKTEVSVLPPTLRKHHSRRTSHLCLSQAVKLTGTCYRTVGSPVC